MLTTIIIYIISAFMAMFAAILSAINWIIPTYIVTGVADIMRGPIYLNGILPMYPHPSMIGIASQTGIMPIFGWFVILLGVVVTLKLIYMFMRVIVRIFSQSADRDITDN